MFDTGTLLTTGGVSTIWLSVLQAKLKRGYAIGDFVIEKAI